MVNQYLRQNEKHLIFEDLHTCNPLIYMDIIILFLAEIKSGKGIVLMDIIKNQHPYQQMTHAWGM